MSFKELSIKGIYRTAVDSLIRDFYLPCLSRASRYDRAVGFFSSSMLIEAAFGLAGLIRNGGRMRLLIGHPLSDDDWQAVKDGTRLSVIQEQLQADLVAVLERAGSDRSVYSLELLSWMVATGSIDIRYAFRKQGMYHEKIGILSDASSNQIVFHGSANESANALLPSRNFESLAVYPSWKTDLFLEYGTPFVDGFESLWSNTTPDILSVPVPSQFYESLLQYRGDNTVPPDLDQEAALAEQIPIPLAEEHPRLPTLLAGRAYALQSHQQTALQRWQANAYTGILALATGSGKTVTALHAATRFCEQRYPLVLVIAVPYQVLGEQWAEVMALFRMRPIKAFYSRDAWKPALDRAISAFRAHAVPFVSVIVVNDSLASEDFQGCLSAIPRKNLFFIADECHHHSSEVWRTRVPLDAKFRLGLSATPWNPGQDDRRRLLEDLYGSVVATYSLRDALEKGVLCPYTYHWIPCQFDDDEADEYERLSAAIAALVAQDPGRSSPSIQIKIQSLASKRVRLLGALRDKSAQLRQLLRTVPPTPHTLFYCGEGQHPLDVATGADDRNIDQIVALVAASKWKVGRITAAETVAERQRTLRSFDDGFIEAIAAIRVLDEGFDIPSCRTAFLLASSNSHRQYVQRRGRVLRRSPGKDHAVIFDFVAIPSQRLLTQNRTLWRRQIETELTRIREFVQLAKNSEAQQLSINEEMRRLGLGAIYYEAAPIEDEDLYGD